MSPVCCSQKVAITSMGILSAVANNCSTFKDALFNGKSHYKFLDFPLLKFPVIGAPIENFSFIESLNQFSNLLEPEKLRLQKMIRKAPFATQVTLIAALEAWLSNQKGFMPFDLERVGLIIATQNNAFRYQYDLHSTFQIHPEYLSPSYALHIMDSDYVGILSDALGIRGDGFTVGAASASGNVALWRAYQLIRDGWLDACLVVGAMADLSPMELQGFYNLGALGGSHFIETPQAACRPFDVSHDGFIYGQASGAILLESIQSMKNRNSSAQAYLLGGATLLDTNHLANPTLDGEIKVIEKAIQQTGININDVDYINAHGTSSVLGDNIEIEAIESVFKNKRVMINSTKSITGHCLWSAGVVEAIACIIQLKNNFVHPTLNLENPISEKSLFIKERSVTTPIQIALNNSFGFGGINSSLVFAKHDINQS